MQDIFNLLNTGSFSSLWYWLFLAVMWSIVSHRPLGVPYDLIGRARRHPEVRADLLALTGIAARRLIGFGQEGVLFVSVAFALIGFVAVLGFVEGYQFCQALTLILVPMVIVALLGLRAARRIEPMTRATPADPKAVIGALIMHRMLVQGIGAVSILLSALWGMAHIPHPL